MNFEIGTLGLYLLGLWSTTGFLAGCVAFYTVWRRNNCNPPNSTMEVLLVWYTQGLLLNPIAGLFVVWIAKFIYLGNTWPLNVGGIIVFLVSMVVSIPTAIWLLEATKSPMARGT